MVIFRGYVSFPEGVSNLGWSRNDKAIEPTNNHAVYGHSKKIIIECGKPHAIDHPQVITMVR